MNALIVPSLFQNGTTEPVTVPSFAEYVYRGAVPRNDDDLQLVTTRTGFDALEPEWNDLFDRAGRGEQMFQTFNWLWHWANHYLTEDANTLAIVTVRRAGPLIAVLPFAIERIAGLKQLVFMGAPVSQYGDALIEDVTDQQAVLSRAMQYAIEETRVDVVRLAKVRDDAAIAKVMATYNADVTAEEEAPFANLAAAGSKDSYDQRFSAKDKKNRRRQERRLTEHGAIGLDWELSGKAAADAARTTMVLKRAWLKTRGQLSKAFADARTDRFFAAVCAGEQKPAGAQVTLLTSGGEMTNAAITVTAKGRQALHILAYGLKFEKCAPGAMHVDRLIERAFAMGVTTLDFLAPRHDYKNEWCDGAIRVADYAVPVTLAGKAYTRVYLGYVRERLKTLAKAAPRGLSTPLGMAQSLMKTLRA